MLHLAFSLFQNIAGSLRSACDSVALPYIRRFFPSNLVSTDRCLSFINHFRRRQMGSFLYLAEPDGSGIYEARKFINSCSFCPFPSRTVSFRNESCQHMAAQWLVSSDDRVVIYFHGGGLFFSVVEQMFSCVISSYFNARVFIPHYRLAPEHNFLSQYDDVLMSYQYLLKQGIPPSKIIVVGQSWGASLALSLLLQLEKRFLPQPSCAILMSPFLSTSWSSLLEHGNDHKADWLLRDHVFSYARLLGFPENFEIGSNWSKLPPVMIQVGQDDFFADSIQKMVFEARSFSDSVRLRVYSGMKHNFHHLYALSSIAEQALGDAGTFVIGSKSLLS